MVAIRSTNRLCRWPLMRDRANMAYIDGKKYSGVAIATEHSEPINALAWSPSGTALASASDDITIQVWDVHTGRNLLSYRGHLMGVKAVAWSPDGKHIASASEDKTVQVWNAANGRNQTIYYGHHDKVNALCWSPDGAHIASASDDGTVHIWNASTGRKTLVYSNHTGFVTTVSWSPAAPSSSPEQRLLYCIRRPRRYRPNMGCHNRQHPAHLSRPQRLDQHARLVP